MKNWKDYVDHFVPSEAYSDEFAAVKAVQLAAKASALGTFAVGAVLLDEQGGILVEGYNQTFIDGFRSDLHAEMVVLNQFEAQHLNAQIPAKLTLVSSLEPCPMCMARLVYAGIGTIRYVCEDPNGGMVTRITALPPKIQEMSHAISQSWAMADCSDDLKHAAQQIWDQSREEGDRRTVARGNTGNAK